MEDDNTYFVDILESAKIALSYLKDINFEDFVKNIQCQDAVIRRLELIGEASSRISEKTQKTYTDLPWAKMKGTRNFLIHEYDDIDLFVVWVTVKENLPPVIEFIQKIL